MIRVQSVEAFDEYNNRFKLAPFYSGKHGSHIVDQDMYWTIRRDQSDWAGGHDEPGCDTYLSVVDSAVKSIEVDQYEQWIITVKALCSNRNLPVRLPYGGGQPAMSVVKRTDVLKEVRCLLAPTAPIRPQLGGSTRWQLVKHLTLNHFSGDEGLATFKSTLALYDFEQTPQTKALIESFTMMILTPATARVVKNGRVGFCQGSDIELEIAGDEILNTRLFFFGCILSHFFSQYTSINSFTRLSIKTRGQSRVVYQGPAIAGGKPLL